MTEKITKINILDIDEQKFIIDFYYGKSNYTATMIHTNDIYEEDSLIDVFDNIVKGVWDNTYDEDFFNIDNRAYCTYILDKLAEEILKSKELRIELYATITQKPPIVLHDNVNHPKHYERQGAMECIDEMEVIFGVEAVQTFCKLNAWKYRYRAAMKNGEEDIRKSDWYLAKCKELSRRVRLNSI